MTRPRKNQIVVNLNSLGGIPVDAESRSQGRIIVYDEVTDSYIHVDLPEGGGLEQYPAYEDLPEVGNPGIIYYVTNENASFRWDETNATYAVYSSPVTFTDIREKPETILGYGITDAWNKTQIGDPFTDYVVLFEDALNS